MLLHSHVINIAVDLDMVLLLSVSQKQMVVQLFIVIIYDVI